MQFITKPSPKLPEMPAVIKDIVFTLKSGNSVKVRDKNDPANKFFAQWYNPYTNMFLGEDGEPFAVDSVEPALPPNKMVKPLNEVMLIAYGLGYELSSIGLTHKSLPEITTAMLLRCGKPPGAYYWIEDFLYEVEPS